MRLGRGFLLVLLIVGFFGIGLAGFVRTPVAHASSKAERAQGAVLFHEKGCEHCHGAEGLGTEKGPNLSGVGRWLHKPEIERQIREGGKEMPAFGETLADDQVQRLVDYLAAKKKKVPRQAWN